MRTVTNPTLQHCSSEVWHDGNLTVVCVSVCSALDLSNSLYKRDVEITDAGLANLAGESLTAYAVHCNCCS